MHFLATYEVGGAECVALNLAKAMQKSCRLSACAIFSNGTMRQRFDEAGVPTLLIGAEQQPGFNVRFLGRVWKMLRAQRPDVLHCHNKRAQMYGILAGRLARVPVIVCTRHGVGTTDRREDAGRFERFVARQASHHVAVCRASVDAGARAGWVDARRVTVIYNGIDTDLYTPPGDRPARPRCLIGCVARLVKEKRLDILLKAARLLVDRRLDVGVRLIGDGPLAAALAEQARTLGLADRVEFLGARKDVPALLHDLDVFTLTSSTEGVPLTALEAMASALPVVATSVGGVPEVVRHDATGFLVPTDSPEAVADALGRLATDAGLRRRMGEEGRRVAIEQFDLRVMARRHEELYHRLLERT